MRVEKPRFNESGFVLCDDCPWSDKNGWSPKCPGDTDTKTCPTDATYERQCAAACRLAEQAEKGE